MEIVVLTGIQAAGKSTFYKERFFKSHMHISLDMLKTRKKEDILIDACIKAKQSFVIDNTNVSVEERRKYIEISKAAKAIISCYYFQTDLKKAIERNKNRDAKECIPSKVIAVAQGKLVLPSYNEGFDMIYIVNITDEGSFEVKELEKEE